MWYSLYSLKRVMDITGRQHDATGVTSNDASLVSVLTGAGVVIALAGFLLMRYLAWWPWGVYTIAAGCGAFVLGLLIALVQAIFDIVRH